jgi:hypothetical protein
MDIARPHIAKKKRRRRILFASGGALALIVITVALSHLKPACRVSIAQRCGSIR